MNLDAKHRKDFRGFAIKRFGPADGETIWLRGVKTFEATEPHPVVGETFSTLRHPIQGFQWSDYSAKPGSEYTYTIACMYGDPGALEQRRSVEVTVNTEVETGPAHSVFFNRGSVATQEYARRFINKTPDKAGPGAFEWLSRGLLEGLIAFIERAGDGDAIHGAVYEFQHPGVLEAIKKANARGAKVKVIYDDVEKVDKDGEAKGPWERNREEIKEAGIKSLCIGRTNAKLMHNKFFVLTQNGTNTAVWTGSTNLTLNGIFGHSNLGHIVEDEAVADAFMAYWLRLKEDPEVDADYREANMAASPVPEQMETGTTSVFSPRGTQLDSLDWYTRIAGGARDALLMTFAFGMHEKFKEVFRAEDGALRMALMEKAYGNAKVKDRDTEDIQRIRNLPNVLVAFGNRIVTNSFDRWLEEMYSVDGKGKHVYWIHTKYMLVDPLGEDPIVVSGSANFSKASTDSNDENMLVIKGDKRIADIYFGEYMRLYSHYSFRESVARALAKKKAGKPEEWTPQYLETDDEWMVDYFDETDDKSARCLRRKYFSGPMAV